MSNVKVSYCNPNSPPHIGEKLTVNYLTQHLGSGEILVNYYLADPPATQEIDLVVINSNGVYLLEVKHWWGKIEGDQKYWLHSSGDRRDSPIATIEHKARVMNSFLKDRGWQQISVTGLVVLSKGAAQLNIDDPNAHKVFGLHQSLVEALTGREYIFNPNYPHLTQTKVHQIRNEIFSSHVADAERWVYGYRIEAERERDQYVELIGQDPEFRSRKVRIKQYDIEAIGSGRELEEAISRFKRDMAALFEAGEHPNLVRPQKFHRDEASDERYYLILDQADTETLADRLAASPIELEEQLRILNDVAAGLAHCHAHNVYHRNLSPASIYLTQQGTAKVGDFDFAKVPTVSRTLAQTGKTLVSGRHVSPEQAFHASDIDQRADIYSLGAVWYDMLFGPRPDENIERERIETAPLPDDAKEILRMMLAERRAERPESMQEVQDWLKTLI